MAMSLNKAMIIGNLGRDPELRYTQGGDPVANFSVATTTRWRDDRGEQQEHTEWHDVVAWRGLAQVAADYLHKGSKVFVEGKLKTRSWDGKDGTKKYRTEIQADQVIVLDPPSRSGYAGASEDESAGASAGVAAAEDGFNPAEISEDDIPF